MYFVEKSGKRVKAGQTLAMFVALAALVFAPAVAFGQAQTYQRVPFASTPNPVGSGGRAIGWGGAFIAVADDATAANWNPAGLVQLIKPEASVVLSYHVRQEDTDFTGYDVDSESRFRSVANINYASVVYPFNVKEVNMAVSLNYQRLYEFDRDLEYTATGINQLGYRFEETRRIEQIGALTTVTPAYSIQITPAFSMGLAVNFWGLEDSGNGWDQRWQVDGWMKDPADPASLVNSWTEIDEEYQVTGVNYVVGLHYKIQNITIGAVYKSAWEADVEYSSHYETANYHPYSPSQNNKAVLDFEDDQKLVWPESYGVGVAYRYSDRLSFAVDAYTIRWSNFELDTDQGDLNLLAGNDQTADVRDAWQVRAGAEYIWLLPKYIVAARGGFFYDPEPLQDEVNDFYGAALGGGLVYKNFVADAALQYRWATDVEGERIQGVGAETDVQELTGIVSLIYHF